MQKITLNVQIQFKDKFVNCSKKSTTGTYNW